MASLILLGPSTDSLQHILSQWGYLAVALFVAIESAGIPFPGESMLIAGAVYAGTGHLSIVGVIAAGAIGAIVGDNIGYLAGRYGGHTLVRRYGKYVRIQPHHLSHGERFFDKYGDRTVFFGRFVAILRAWSAFLAGTNSMPWPKFLLFNALGGITWAVVYGMLGYILGRNLQLLHQVLQILGVTGVVAAILVAGVGYFVWKRRRRRTSPDPSD